MESQANVGGELGRSAEPRLTKEMLKTVLDIYKTAWEQQDSKLILTIFTEDALYHERVLQEPIRGHAGIAKYWQKKVMKEQARISWTLLRTYIDGTTGIAEWEVYFDDLVEQKRIHSMEIAIMEFNNRKITSLREYWAAETIDEL
jgi:hypothetical protein